MAEGASLYEGQCAQCHGATGAEGPIAPLVGEGYARAAVGYWPSAVTLFEYTRRAMPFHAPKSLSPDQTYANVAYMLSQGGVVESDTTLDAASLATITMPNADGFQSLWDVQGEKPY